jgi:pimeloyl-ACP methyl ester carboxylesterase
MPLAQTANGSIWYADHRDPTQQRCPVTLFVHGAGGTHLDWPAELRRLPEANAICPDLPGHGRSPGLGRQTIPGYAADMVALLNTLHIEQAIIAGHSMGGAIALTLALQYPNRVLGLMLFGTGAKLGVHPDILGGMLDETAKSVNLILGGYWGAGATDSMRRRTQQRLIEFNPTILYNDYSACSRFDVRTELNQIRVPVLIVGGTDDRMTPFKFSSYLHEHITGSELVTVEGGGHMMILEQPAAVGAAAANWLRAHFGV